MAQLPVMIGLALHYPTVRIDVFSVSIRTAYDTGTNQTVVAARNGSAVGVSSYDHGVGISGLYVVNAASLAFFVVMTMNFVERGVMMADDPLRERGLSAMAEEEFVAQNLGMVSDPTFRAWNQVLDEVMCMCVVNQLGHMPFEFALCNLREFSWSTSSCARENDTVDQDSGNRMVI